MGHKAMDLTDLKLDIAQYKVSCRPTTARMQIWSCLLYHTIHGALRSIALNAFCFGTAIMISVLSPISPLGCSIPFQNTKGVLFSASRFHAHDDVL